MYRQLRLASIRAQVHARLGGFVPNYIARVELHSATYADYEQLHAAMQQLGFARTVRGDNQTAYQLPTATYIMRNVTITLADACNAAVAAAITTGKTHSLIVTDWISAQWSGLAPV
jgi:hypothetical protein